MSVQKYNTKDQWQNIINTLDVSQEMRNYLMMCRINNIKISQAEKAWEISFQCPYLPDENIKKCIHDVWKNIFGESYGLIFHYGADKEYADLTSLCSECWEEIIGKIARNFPTCRGWLPNSSYSVDGNNLEIEIENEIGWSYLASHSFTTKLELLLKEEYHFQAKVNILLKDSLQETDTDTRCYLDELEDNYRERFADTIEKAGKNKTEPKEKKEKSKIIIGKRINGKITPIEKIIEEENNVIVQAFVFNIEARILKTGRTLINFAVSDKADSLSCKIIADQKSAEEILDNLKENEWYLFRGQVQTDRYTQELTLMPHDICETTIERRIDSCEKKRIELHLHTKMSALDGLADVREVIKRASEWGHSAVAITDHGVVQSFPEAYEAAKKYGIRVIYGLEGYLYDETASRKSMQNKTPTYHCIILACNQEGLRNLYELVTISHLQHYHRVPRIPKSELQRLRKGLLIGSACEAGELIQAYLKGMDKTGLEELASFYDYLEIQPRGNNNFMIGNGQLNSEEDLIIMNKTIYEIAKKLQKPIVATGDVHFIDPEDEVYRRVLMAGKGFEDADNQAPLYFKTTQEMLDEFAYLGEKEAYEVVIDNAYGIAAIVDDLKPIPSDFFPPEIKGAEDEIQQLTLSKAVELYGENLPEIVQKRIERELNSIINNGFAVLYLIAHKLVKKSNSDGYIVGSRGSVGSSLVATFCGITEVNPLPPHYRCAHCKYVNFINDGTVNAGFDLPDNECPQCGKKLIKDGHNILFEVFMGFEGDKVPDIDLNFSGDYQPRAHKYTEELFGKDNVFRAGTIATIANKTAFGFVKNYYEERKKVVRMPEINRLVGGCTGVKRTTGQHPGGIMVLPKGLDVHNFTPLQRPADDIKSDIITTHFDYHAISSRLVKLDILGHDDPTVLKMLEDLTGVDCRTIPLDEEKVLSLFRSTEALGIEAKELGSKMGTLGIPEFGTKFVRQMLEDTNPQTFSDLVMISGFSHGTDVWLNNAQDLIKSGTAKVSEVISTRDDIMLNLIQKGVNPDKAFKIMEDVRKGKGVRADYVAILKENQVHDWYIESCQKIKYLFPKAHASAYVTMAFRIAYYKIYYPAAFYASFFTVRADEFDADIIVGGIPSIKENMDKIAKKGNDATQKEEKLFTILELALEMYLRGIKLKKVDLNKSDWNNFQIVDEEKSLLPPFVSLQGLGQTAAQSIIRARNEKPFISQEDLRIRAKLSKTVIDVLNNHGCINDLPLNDQISLF